MRTCGSAPPASNLRLPMSAKCLEPCADPSRQAPLDQRADLAGEGSSTDLFMAIHSAAEKLEKQAVKARTKWRDNKRTPRKSASEAEIEAPAPEVEVEAEEETTPERRVFHVGH